MVGFSSHVMERFPDPMGLSCAYPRCGGTLAVQAGTGYCLQCKQPSRLCTACQTWNRSLAAWCRHCAADLKPDPSESAGPSLSPEAFAGPATRIQIPEACWSAPQAAAGYLWTVTESGQLYQINPHSDQPSLQHAFGEGAGYSSFIVREMARAEDPSLTELCALAAVRGGIKVFGLVSKAERMFSTLEPGEEILAECLDRYHLLNAWPGTVWCLTNREGSTRLLGLDVSSGNAVRHELEAGIAAGPVLFQDYLMVWSEQSVLIRSTAGWERLPFQGGFEAWTVPQPAAPLRFPLGSAPAMSASGTLYLPGNQNGQPALLMLRRENGAWAQAVIQIPSPAACGRDASGQPLLSQAGSLSVCTESGLRQIHADKDILATRVAYSAGNFRAYFCEGGPPEVLRFHRGYEDRAIHLEFPDGLVECSGFWDVGTAFVIRVLTGKQGQRMTEFLALDSIGQEGMAPV